MKRSALLGMTVLALVSVSAAHVPDVWARAGGGGGGRSGGSIGSRGSRSYSAPARPAPTTPTSPSRSLSPAPAPSQSPFTPQRPSFFRGIMGGIAGFALGGLIGSMLFGHGGGFGGGGFGVGFFDLVLIGAALVFLFMFLRRRREQDASTSYGQRPAYAMAGGPGAYDPAPTGSGGTTV